MISFFYKILAAEQKLMVLPGQGSYKSITADTVLEALNPFHGTSGIDNVFDFVMVIIRILLTFGGVIGIGFIVYGGYMYITSGGSPEATKKATNTITWAIVGVVIAFSAAVIIDFIIRQLGIEVPEPNS